MKHWNKPWEFDEPENWYGIGARVHSGFLPIAQVQYAGWPIKTARANAALIAAAPDLLKCCLDALTTDGVIVTDEIGYAMEEAIEKATGMTLDELFPEAHTK